MKHSKFSLVVFLGLALVVTGCNKKASDQLAANQGFDSLSSTEELAQLPQNAASSSQHASVEILPVETSPVTQSAQLSASPALEAASSTLSHEQKIQTALKNAGLYEGAIDGKIGAKTKKAIETFQTNNGLKVDGKVGPKTWAAMEPYLSGTASAPVQQ